MYIYEYNKGHYINIFKRIMLHFRAVILILFNEDLYSYYHKKFEVISLFKVCKKQNELINLHVHLLVEQRRLYKHF